MKLRKVINRRMRHEGGGLDIVADINNAIAGNVDEADANRVSVSSTQSIVQRSGSRRRKESHD